jgi:hypothetical protein
VAIIKNFLSVKPVGAKNLSPLPKNANSEPRSNSSKKQGCLGKQELQEGRKGFVF